MICLHTLLTLFSEENLATERNHRRPLDNILPFYFSNAILLLLAVMKATAQVPLLTPWRKVGTTTDRRRKGSWDINGLKICESADESDSRGRAGERRTTGFISLLWRIDAEWMLS
jgi:hypothetical protein